MNLSKPSELKEILARHGFSFSKSLGQNFLIDSNVLDKIVTAANICADDCVLEIGPGAGTLTRCLAQAAKRVVAVEIDKALIPVLNETMAEYENFKLINEDILKVDLEKLVETEFGGSGFHVVANLPYYITTPIVMALLENKLPVKSMTVMVQKEVADRMCAKSGGKDYGALSVAVQYYCTASVICKAEPHCFIPQPRVASSVVSLRVGEKPTVSVKDEKLFFAVVKSAFGQRRKTMLNAVSKSPFVLADKEKIADIFDKMGLSSDIRGEKMSIEQFAEFTDLLLD